VQRRGITRTPGLYFFGVHRMHTIKSGLPSGTGNDAEYLAEHIAGAN
jgi:putative flavoprotein involved in K+ transport